MLSALRAGLCFERLGEVEDARTAYDWLCQRRHQGGPLVTAARLRLQVLARSGKLADRRELLESARRGDSTSTLVRDELAGHMRTLGVEIGRGAKQLRDLERKRRELQRYLTSVRLLRDRLQSRGVTVIVGSGSLYADVAGVVVPDLGPSRPAVQPALRPESLQSVTEADSMLGSFRRQLEGELRGILPTGSSFDGLLPVLADQFSRAALRALMTRDVATAKRNFEQALALSGDHDVAVEFLENLRSWQASRWLGDLARRRLLEEHLRRTGELQKKIRSDLVSARHDFLVMDRPDRSVSSIVKIRELVSRAPAEARREAEISYLVREAERLFLALTTGGSYAALSEGSQTETHEPPSPGGLRRLWAKREDQNRQANDLLEELVEQTTSKLTLRTDAAIHGNAEAMMIVTGELQRLLAEGRNFLMKGSGEKTREAILQADLLVDWSPGLDPDGSYRQQIHFLRQRLERDTRARPSLQEELDGED